MKGDVAMKKWCLKICLALGMAALLVGSGSAETRRIVDMSGRELEIPAVPQRIYSTNPIGTTLIYTLAPDQLLGWNYPLSDREKHFIPEPYRSLPVVGGWYSTREGNLEKILTFKPDLFVCMSSLDESTLSFVEKLQNQTGIPVVVASYELAHLDETYRFLGDLLGEKERARALANYCAETVRQVREGVETIPEKSRLRVYYAEGPDGQRTDPEGSRHTQVLSMAGGINVAQVPRGSGAGMAAVSLEQIFLWDPDVIFAWKKGRGGFFEEISGNSDWQKLRAVRSGEVYGVPDNPFCWFDRPPSVNRVLGLRWTSHLLYPEVFPRNMIEEAQEFYGLFWHYRLSEDEARQILEGSLRRP
jgi:iron complex transport system substrate-binding protein